MLYGTPFRIDYDSGLRVTATYHDQTRMTWRAESGMCGTEETHTVEVRPHLYFVSWLEGDSGTTVSQVIDLTEGSVHAYVTFVANGDRTGFFQSGTIRR